jgi:adenylyl cyclase-associated protein
MSHIDRLENLALQLGIAVGGEGALPPSVTVYDSFYEAQVVPFMEACKAMDNKSMTKMAASCEVAFQHQRTFIYGATACAKPSDADLMAFIQPIAKAIQAADRLPRRTKVIDHLKAWNEAIQALNWLCMPNGGVPFIVSQRDAAQFHLNRVLSKARDFDDEEKTAKHKAFVNALKNMVTELSEYVKSFHKTGIVWKFGGGNLAEFSPEEGATDAKRSDEDRMEDVVTALEAYAARLSGGDGDGPPPAILDWQALLETELKAFTDACNALSGVDGKQLADWAVQAWTHCGKVIEATLESKKPADEKWAPFLGPIVEVAVYSAS